MLVITFLKKIPNQDAYECATWGSINGHRGGGKSLRGRCEGGGNCRCSSCSRKICGRRRERVSDCRVGDSLGLGRVVRADDSDGIGGLCGDGNGGGFVDDLVRGSDGSGRGRNTSEGNRAHLRHTGCSCTRG